MLSFKTALTVLFILGSVFSLRAAEFEDAPAAKLPAVIAPLPLAALESSPAAIPALEAPLAIAVAAQEAPAAAQAPSAAQSLEQTAARLAEPKASEGDTPRAVSTLLFDKAVDVDAAVIPPAEGADEISREIEEPPELLRHNGIHATVTVYGSARIPSPEQARANHKAVIEQYGRRPKSADGKKALKAARQDLANSRYYELARRFGELVARGGKGRIAIVTGGGPGIMEAANRGAFEAGGPSVGFNIKLPHEQDPNPYITPGLSFDFEYFSSRKTNMRHGSVAMAFFPGGFGTMDELFEVLTLMQTGKIPRVPIVLVGEKGYWGKVLDFEAFSRMGLISPEDLKLFHFAETAETAWKLVSGHAARAK